MDITKYEKFKILREKIGTVNSIHICGDDCIGSGIYGADETITYIIYNNEPDEIVVYFENENEDMEELFIITVNSTVFEEYMTLDPGFYGRVSTDIHKLIG